MAELADAPDLGSGVYDVQVQVLSSAVIAEKTIVEYSGLFYFLKRSCISVDKRKIWKKEKILSKNAWHFAPDAVL